MEEEEKRRQEESRQRQESTANVPEREPVMVRIGDRDVDISGTEIDRDYIEALPEDMREKSLLCTYEKEGQMPRLRIQMFVKLILTF